MQQMPVNNEDIIAVDYESGHYPASIKEFRPTVYKEGDHFCCLLGPNTEIGVFATGSSIDEAIMNWHEAYQKRIQNLKPPFNEVDLYLKDSLSITKKDVW